MTLLDIANKIPEEYQTEILQTNMIGKAQPIQSDTSMMYLFKVWKTCVEPHEDLKPDCSYCLDRILKNYRQLVPTLVQLEKERRLLN